MFCVVVLYSLKFDHADCIDDVIDVVVDDDMMINGSTFWKLSISFFLFSFFFFSHAYTHTHTRMRSILYILKYGEVIRCYSRPVCLGIVKRVKCIRVHFLFIFW